MTLGKKIILGVLLLVLIMPIISAESSFIFQQNSEAEIKVSCIGTSYNYCPNTVGCNLTIQYPNGTTLLEDKVMTYNPSFYNYTLLSNQTTILGEYSASVSCSASLYGFSTFNFKITPNGEELTIANVTFNSGLLLLLLILLFSFGVISYKSDNIFHKLGWMSATFLVVVITLFTVWQFSDNYMVSLLFVPAFMRILFIVACVGFFGWIMFTMAYSFYLIVTIKEMKALAERGIPEDRIYQRKVGKWFGRPEW